VSDSKSDILQGTLDLMVLKTLDAMGPMHGYGIARRIEQISEDALHINQGTIYLCLIRLVQKGWVDASWGTSENNRKAKFYAISKAGKKQLAAAKERAQPRHHLFERCHRYLFDRSRTRPITPATRSQFLVSAASCFLPAFEMA
jgi:PadR family transcriptional regulator PadR